MSTGDDQAPRALMPSGGASSDGSRRVARPSASSSTGGGCPRLTSRTVSSPSENSAIRAVVNPSSCSCPPRRPPSRSSARSSAATRPGRSSASSAAYRNAPRSAQTALTAPSPLPRTSPTITRTPCGVSWTTYRSPPIMASSSAGTYRAAIRSSPRREGGRGRTALWATAAMCRARRVRASRPSRARLIRTASTVTARRVSWLATPRCHPKVPSNHARTAWTAMASAPIAMMPRRVSRGAAATGAAISRGAEVTSVGVTRSSTTPSTMTPNGIHLALRGCTTPPRCTEPVRYASRRPRSTRDPGAPSGGGPVPGGRRPAPGQRAHRAPPGNRGGPTNRRSDAAPARPGSTPAAESRGRGRRRTRRRAGYGGP